MDKTVKPLRAFVAAALLGTIIAPVPGAGATAAPQGARYVPGEVVVALRGRLGLERSLTRAKALAGKVGGRVVKVSARGGAAAVISVSPDADVKELARRLGAEKDVRFAEPNYVYRVADLSGAGARWTIKATRPSDTLLTSRSGWDWVNAAIVWNNTTPSKNVCVIDTGVDYLHPDLTTARVIKGKDRVNEDADPMDDNGHGTHVAGIIAAKQNNAQGIAGVSPTAKVVAEKALNADGWGTSYDIQQAIRDCADRSDVSIINVSFGGPYSVLQKEAVDYATNIKHKVLVAAAGNESSETPYCSDETSPEDPNPDHAGQPLDWRKSGIRAYPAGFALASNQYYWDGATCVDSGTLLHDGNAAILSVGAGGAVDSGGDFSCRAEYSNSGEWVNVTAPGTDILSTTPWDKPFTMNSTDGLAPRYGVLSGTSAATGFVSGAAARAWGYKSSFTNAELAGYVKSTGRPVPAAGGGLEQICQPETVWPANMGGATDVNVAAALDRGALIAEAIDAVSGLPLVGATIQALQGSSVKASATLAFVPASTDATGLQDSPAAVTLINLPALVTTTLKVSKSGYTASATNAFVGAEYSSGNPDGTVEAPRGAWRYAGYAAVPPKSARFTAVSAWDRWEERSAPVLATALPDKETKASNDAIWDGQPADFVVGHDVCDYADLEGDNAGELLVFPNAQAVYQNLVGTHQIDNRSEAGFSGLPQWTGTYVLSVYNPDMDFDYRQGSLFIWKDGSLKKRVDMTDPGCATSGSFFDWWEAATISSGKSGSVVIEIVNECKDSGSMVFPVSCVP